MNSSHTFTTWECGYFTEEVTNKFHQLYVNHKKEFANIWREIALRFKGDPNILGYELLNEPWTGDFFDDYSLLLPGNTGYTLLQPFSEAASDGIREVDDETIVFWEPLTYAYFIDSLPVVELGLDAYFNTHNWTVLIPLLEKLCGPMADGVTTQDFAFLGQQPAASSDSPSSPRRPASVSSLGPGFTAPPGGMDYLNRTAMSWHYYCWALGYGHPDVEYDPALKFICDQVAGPIVFDTVDHRASELGGSASMLTEFGICVPSYDHPTYEGTGECNFVLDQADKHF